MKPSLRLFFPLALVGFTLLVPFQLNVPKRSEGSMVHATCERGRGGWTQIVGTVLVLGAGFRAEDKPDGAALFKQKCSMCHGADGKGYSAIKTPDFTDPKWQESRTDQEIVEVIKNGKKGTAMLAFGDKLKEEEIQALVAQIRSFNSKKSGEKNEKK